MAQRAESLNIEGTPACLAPVVAMPAGETASKRTLNKAISGIEAALRSAQHRALQTYNAAARKSGAMASAFGERLRRTRNEKPLQIVAVAAATGLVLGIALRLWRSRYE